MSLIDDILHYFSWEKVEKIFPGGKGIYHLFEIDLSEAHTDKRYDFLGDQLIITECASQVYLRLNDIENSLIDLSLVRQIGPTPIKEFYITNSVGSGNLKILAGSKNLFKCSIPQLTDIITQSVDRIIIRDQDGLAESSETASWVIAGGGNEHDFVDITGKGSLRWFYINTQVNAGASNVKPKIYIDGTLLRPALSFAGWSALGMDANTRPFQLLKYNDPENFYSGSYYFEKGIVFDTSLKLSCYNSDLDNQIVTVRWLYQKIT